MSVWPKACVECGRDIYPKRWAIPWADRHYGRGMCGICYQNQRRADGFQPGKRRPHRCAEVLEEWTFLREQGIPHVDIAARLGMRPQSLDRALLRAKAAA